MLAHSAQPFNHCLFNHFLWTDPCSLCLSKNIRNSSIFSSFKLRTTASEFVLQAFYRMLRATTGMTTKLFTRCEVKFTMAPFYKICFHACQLSDWSEAWDYCFYIRIIGIYYFEISITADKCLSKNDVGKHSHLKMR